MVKLNDFGSAKFNKNPNTTGGYGATRMALPHLDVLTFFSFLLRTRTHLGFGEDWYCCRVFMGYVSDWVYPRRDCYGQKFRPIAL